MWATDGFGYRWTASLGGVIVGALTVVSLNAVDAAMQINGADAPAQISACVKRESGEIRLAGSSDDCKKSETLLVWNIQGPIGPKGANGCAATIKSAGSDN